ncbi:MAG: hypothetical protein K2Q06_13890, partial [Parvularculaceae bacterium]|nr:hypothetical protein [Parvularculaceae bacterium]
GFFPPTESERREMAARGPGGAGFGPPPGAGQGGRGGFAGGPPRAGRMSVSVFYVRRLDDEATLFAGQPPLELVAAAPLGSAFGGGPDRLEFEGGFSWRGAGLRVSGNWASPYRAPGLTAAQDLFYSDATTINLRAFVGFDSRPALVREHPILRGVRLIARADNVFDAAPNVRDGTGAEPFALQKGFLAPTGRSWSVGIRKQW